MRSNDEIIYPDYDCSLCPRLKAFIDQNRQQYPEFYNGPVLPFGPIDAKLLIIGLAPGLKGANATGRPFTGDYAGDLLYKMLLSHGLASGEYQGHADDGLMLKGVYITNAVKCVPPQNKPVGAEINTCRPFLISEIDHMPNLKAILCLGKISHDTTLRLMGAKLSAYPFKHGAEYDVRYGESDRVFKIFDSYHCSRYNTNTGRLTEDMFNDIFKALIVYLRLS